MDLSGGLLMSKYILALDQATANTGWALFKDGKLEDYGVARTDGFEEQKINAMRNWLVKKIQELKLIPEAKITVILEDIQLQRNDVKTFKVLAHLQGVLINVIYREDVKMFIYYSSEWKSSCGIKGKDRTTQKNNAQKFIQETYGVKPIQDTCDAICLGIHHIKQEDSVINFE
jgi:Holliday junction resolvasome RuvABC endonuclease subunit